MMNNFLKTAICVLIIAIGAAAQTQSKPLRLSSATVFPGGFISYSMRDGYRKYEDVREAEHIELNNLVMYGIFGGKRFPLKNPRLRIQSTLELGWNGDSVVDEVYEGILLTDGRSVDIFMHSYLFTIGIQNELHILLPSTGNGSPFFSLGQGVGWGSFERVGKTDFRKAGRTNLAYNVQGIHDITNTLCFNFNIGAGIDYKSNEKHTLSIGYNFRIWRPVSYNDLSLFPMGVDYRELFFTHMLQAQVLILPKGSKVRY